MEEIIKLKVKKHLDTFTLKAEFSFVRGFNVITGPSGSGKTTLLRIMCGFEKPNEGFMEHSGKIIFNTYKNIFLPPQKRNLSLVFQGENLIPHLTLIENIKFALKYRKADEDIENLLALFGIKGIEHKYPKEVSGGERQRVAILRSIIGNPSAILMDEPFSSLDFNIKVEIMRFLKEKLKFNVPVILTTHDPMEALFLADKIFILLKGKKVAEGGREVIKAYFKPQLKLMSNLLF